MKETKHVSVYTRKSVTIRLREVTIFSLFKNDVWKLESIVVGYQIGQHTWPTRILVWQRASGRVKACNFLTDHQESEEDKLLVCYLRKTHKEQLGSFELLIVFSVSGECTMATNI